MLSEFLTIASGLLAGVSMDLIDAGIEHFLECRATIQARHNRRWRETAAYIDGKARVWIPTLYFVLLMLIFNLELEDGYTPDENGETVSKKMFYGLPPIIRVEDGMFGYIRILFLPVCACIFLPLFLVAKQLVSRCPRTHAPRTRVEVARHTGARSPAPAWPRTVAGLSHKARRR